MLLNDVARHGSSGPTPVKNSRNRPIGTATRLYHGAPTVTLLPTTYSERIGKSVPTEFTKQAVSSTRLLNRKARLAAHQRLQMVFALQVLRCKTYVKMHTASTIPMKIANQVPMAIRKRVYRTHAAPARVSSVPSSSAGGRKKAMMKLTCGHAFLDLPADDAGNAADPARGW